jgi:uncharacterized protein YjeT (DUF2065 family)
MKFFLMVLGTVLFIEGLPYFASPSTIKKMMAEIQSMDNKLLRLMGFLAMFGGLIAVWYATRLP